jgi:large-conductance mechanosensitive channel
MDNPVFIILLFLFVSTPVLLILANLDRMRKRDTEMREGQKETNRLLTEITSLLKNRA